MQAVILAAGKGTRLRPLTLTRSKAMAPVAGKPMIERVMATFMKNGVNDFVIVVSEDDKEIGPYFKENTRLDARFQFVFQPKRLGMANALSLAAPYLHGTFILSACDSIVPVNHVAALLSMHQTAQARATLSLKTLAPAQISKSSAVELDGHRVRRIVEKPTLEEAPSNIGSLPLYVFSPDILPYLPMVPLSPRGEYELQDAIQMLIENEGQVTGVLTDSRVQLTNVQDLLDLTRHYLDQEQPALPGSAELNGIDPNTRLRPYVKIEKGAIIGANCTIGPNVYIESNCRIGDNVHLENAVVLRNSVIGDGQTIIGDVIA